MSIVPRWTITAVPDWRTSTISIEDDPVDGAYVLFTDYERAVAEARQQALLDDVEAVRLSPSADIDLVERSQVVAEIEALNNRQEAK